MDNRISVIIPVYNHAHSIKKALDSVCLQTILPAETIIVNDGSTDDFITVMAGILADSKYDRLNLKVINQLNRGAPAARNRGFSESTGRYIIFWDADTIAKPKMLEKMMGALCVEPGASFAYSGFKYGWKKFACREYDVAALKETNFIDVTALIKREDFLGFDEDLTRFQDWDLWLSMMEQNKTGVFVPEILYMKITGRRSEGMSRWLPKFIYRLPLKSETVKEYERAKMVVARKHGLPPV